MDIFSFSASLPPFAGLSSKRIVYLPDCPPVCETCLAALPA